MPLLSLALLAVAGGLVAALFGFFSAEYLMIDDSQSRIITSVVAMLFGIGLMLDVMLITGGPLLLSILFAYACCITGAIFLWIFESVNNQESFFHWEY